MAGLDSELQAIVDDAAVASSALGTIAAGSDAVVANFAGLQDLVDSLSAFAVKMKAGEFYAPVGLIAPFGGLSGVVPDGWLLCDGSAKSQYTYSALYGVLGANAYGTDAEGNFYLPDLKGRTVFGLNSANADVDSRLDSDGAAAAVRSPKHKHSIASLGASSSVGTLTAQSGGIDHTHNYSIVAQTNASTGYNTGLLRFADTNATLGGYSPATSGASAYLHTHNVTGTINTSLSGTVGVGSGTADTIPYVVANYIIKA